MKVLYITSTTEKAGKTMLCAGLAKYWSDSGKKAGYLKVTVSAETTADKDAVFMQKLLGLQESVESLQADPASVKESAAKIADSKDVLIVEGLSLSGSASIIESLDARVLIVHDYATPAAKARDEYKKLGGWLAGVVLNKIPKNKLAVYKKQASADLAGINIIGAIPEDRILAALSIADLAEAVQGKILNNAEKSGELIEKIMIGSSTFERGPAYYNREVNKAVIVWGDKPGVRKAALAGLPVSALQTSTRCVVITNNVPPLPTVMQKAEEKQVPIISAEGNMAAVIHALENSAGRLKFNQENKLPRLAEVLGQNLKLDEVSKVMGMAS